MQVPIRTVAKILKTKFRLSYRKVKRVSTQGNSERCLVLRHLYAREMLKIYSEGKHIINIDESWIPHTDFRRQRWGTRKENNSMADKVLGYKVNMIVAVSSEGRVWLALT